MKLQEGALRSLCSVATLCFLITSAAVLSSCGGEDAAGGLDPAIVEKADFIGRVDYRSFRGAPISEFLESRRQSEGPESAEEDLSSRLSAAAEIEESDITGILVSGNLEGADFEGTFTRASAEAVDASLAIGFARPLRPDRFEAGVQLLVDESGAADMKRLQAGGKTILCLVPHGPEEPLLYTALSSDGRAVYAAFSEHSLYKTLEREGEGNELPRKLREAEAMLPAGAQLKYTFVVPPGMKAQADAKMAELESGAAQNPGIGMVYGLIKPFRNLSAFTLGMEFSDNVDISLIADLSTEGDAVQAAALIQTMAVPFLTSQLARKGGGTMSDFSDRLTVANEGSTVRMALSLSESDLTALQSASR